MKFNSQELVQDLKQHTESNLQTAQEWLELPLKVLQFKPSAESWSLLECLEHLNLYGDFYLPEIRRQMENSPYQNAAPIFKSSWLGNYFAKAMLPKEPLNSMKTFREKDPKGSSLDQQVVQKFINQQQEMLELLQQARRVNLTKIKTGITLTQWIRLRLGDTFRVVIYHNDRHLVQAKQVLAYQKNASSNPPKATV
jgi:hypothetical protein